MFISTKEANLLFQEGEYEKALAAYQRIGQEHPDLKCIFTANIELCKKNILKSGINKNFEAPEIFITLTTISDRLSRLLPVLESLHKQTLRPQKIYLNISEEAYLLDKGIRKDDPRLASFIKLPLLEINWTKNTGPFRKIIPFMESFFSENKTKDKIFITVDDDTLYPDYFIQTLYDKYLEHDSVIAFRGRYITANSSGINPYSNWELGKTVATMNNLPTGKDGILYSTKFFTRDFVDINAALELTPTADDLWIKWHCGLNGVKSVILNPEASTSDYKSFPVVDYSAEYRDVSLFKAHNSSASGGKNDISTKNLEKYFLKKYGYNLHTLCEKQGSML
ncbi:Uncharacterised protein [uncultured Comamonas sp.]|nr:Uncharacterised protein [uncultured Comamonas sp.]